MRIIIIVVDVFFFDELLSLSDFPKMLKGLKPPKRPPTPPAMLSRKDMILT